MLFALVTLVLTPWHGPSLPTASADAVKFKLAVHGAPNQSVPLRASGLPAGWVASFCTSQFCSPFSYTLPLDRSGNGTVEFQAIRVDTKAPAHTRVVVSAQGGASKTVSW
jgi:hypothetical protein